MPYLVLIEDPVFMSTLKTGLHFMWSSEPCKLKVEQFLQGRDSVFISQLF